MSAKQPRVIMLEGRIAELEKENADLQKFYEEVSETKESLADQLSKCVDFSLELKKQVERVINENGKLREQMKEAEK